MNGNSELHASNSHHDWHTLLESTQQMRLTLDLLLERLNLERPPTSLGESLVPSPKVELRGANLLVNGALVPLSSRPLTYKLLEVFLRRPEGIAHKLDILQHVYQLRPGASLRQIQAQECSLNKLMSRTRTFLAEALAPLPWSIHYEWLVYQHKSKGWHLVLLRSE